MALTVQNAPSVVLTPDQCEEVRQEAVSLALAHVKEILSTLIDKAIAGDVPSARIVLEVAGLLRRPMVGMVGIKNEIRIDPAELEALRRDLEADYRAE